MIGVSEGRGLDHGPAPRRFLPSFMRVAFLASSIFVPAAAQHSSVPLLSPVEASANYNAQIQSYPAVWFADHHSANRVPVGAAQLDHVIPIAHEATALAIDPRDKALWVLTHKRVLKFDAETSLILEVDLKSISLNSKSSGDAKNKESGNEGIEDPDTLVVNPHDGSLWIGAKRTLLHVDREARLLSVWRAPDKISYLSLSLDGSVWVLMKKRLVHLSAHAIELETFDFSSEQRTHFRYLAVDALGGVVWLATDRALSQLKLADLSTGTPMEIYPATPQEEQRQGKDPDEEDVDEIGNQDDDNQRIQGITLDSATGTIWLAHKQSVLAFHRNGTPLTKLHLAQDVNRIEAIAFDSPSRVLLIGAKKKFVQVGNDGHVIAKIELRNELQALAASPLLLSPQLTVLQPSAETLTNNAKFPIVLNLGAQCNEGACDVGSTYIYGLSLDVVLNGEAIGSRFLPSDHEVVYVPTDRHPEGLNTFTAQARDAFGHLSVRISGRFTVDTTPPTFLTLSPADGSTVSTSEITLTGGLDDAAAVIVLENLASLGATVVQDDPLDFSFKIPLKPGPNEFTLVATDGAGNQTVAKLHVTLNTLSIAVTNLTSGQSIDSDRALVMGTFDGPINTGITVNGVIALTYGKQFFANAVPLNPGSNTIKVVATTLDAQSVIEELNIVSTAKALISVSASRLAPQEKRTISTHAGNGTGTYAGDNGPAIQASLRIPSDIAACGDGNMIIADTGNQRIRKITSSGFITTIAGTGGFGFSGDNEQATFAKLNRPFGVACGGDGSIYIADTYNSRIRKIDTHGIITTVAGSGVYGFSGDGGPAAEAQLRYPRGVVYAPDGAIYFSDTNNHRIRRITADGVVDTVAGDGIAGYKGDGGPASLSSLNRPSGLALGPDGSLYVADTGNYRVRRLYPDGTITTVAGTGTYGSSGDNASATEAKLSDVSDVAVDVDGTIYIADTLNNRIRRVSADGKIDTLAGTGVYGYYGDGGDASKATLARPTGVAITSGQQLYITDNYNNRIRKITTAKESGWVAFEISNLTSNTLKRIEADFDGDGVVDASDTNVGAPMKHLYPTPGVYLATFLATDSQESSYGETIAVVIEDEQQEDERFLSLWNGMNNRLVEGDIQGAGLYITPMAKQKYAAAFTVLAPHMAGIVSSYSPLQRVSVSPGIGEYTVVREIDGRKHLHFIYFLRDTDGVWRLDAM